MNQPSKATKQRTVIGLRANGLAAAALSAAALFSVSADAVAQHYIFTDLGTLGGTQSYATGINNAGQVVGASGVTGSGAWHATLWNGTTATDLGTLLGGTHSGAAGINNAGQVVGYSDSIGYVNYHATLWNGTTATNLGTVGGIGGYASGINNAGQVVGSSNAIGDVYAHATLWNGTTIVDLNSFLSAPDVAAGWMLGAASGINDSGWITGSAINRLTGKSHAFLLSIAAVPEPETYAMMLAGLGALGLVIRRRRGPAL